GEASMQLAIRLISSKYPSIVPIRCIAHLLNLITSDIIKIKFAKNILSKCQVIIKHFRTVYRAGAIFKEELIEQLIIGGGLKSSYKSRWSTAWDCTDSILRCELIIKAAIDNHPKLFKKTEIIKIISDRQFWINVEQLHKVLEAPKQAITSVESKTATLASIFVDLLKMANAIKKLPSIQNLEFKRLCINIYNRRWAEFDIDLFLLGYFFHPYFRFLPGVFCRVCHTALSIWLKMDGGKYSSTQLLSQMTSYKQYEDPYDISFDLYSSSVQNWWMTIDQRNNHIQKLALKILAILNYINQEISDEDLENTIADIIYAMFTETELFNNEEDEQELENLLSNNNIDNAFSNTDIMLENIIDITSIIDNLELEHEFEEEVDHGTTNFDIDAMLDNANLE
ncbi:1271_t:CDS:2, partial [Racocetra fulgida]